MCNFSICLFCVHNCIPNAVQDYRLLHSTDVTEHANILLYNAHTVMCAPQGIPSFIRAWWRCLDFIGSYLFLIAEQEV